MLWNEEVCDKGKSHNPSLYLLPQTDSMSINLYGKTDAEISGILSVDKLLISKTDLSFSLESGTRITNLRNTNINRLSTGNLNIYSISCTSKFDQWKLLVQGKFDILVITDESLPFYLFQIDGISMLYRLNRIGNGGKHQVCADENIPSKKLKIHKILNDVEDIFIEVNLL